MKNIFKILSRFRFLNKIVSQFIISHLLLVFISISLVGIFLLTATKTFIQDSVNTYNLEKAEATASDVEIFVKNTFDLLAFSTNFNEVNEMEEFRQTQALNKLHLQYDFFRTIYVFDTLNNIVSSTLLGSESTDISQNFLSLPIENKSLNISPVFIEDNEPRVTVSAPIYKFDLRVGTIAAKVSVNFIWEHIDSLSAKIEGGAAFLLDKSGKVIAHPDRRLVFNQDYFAEFSFVKDLTEGNKGTSSYNDPLSNNDTYICAYTPVYGLDWGIVVAQPESIAFSVYRDILISLGIIILGSFMLASILAVVITRNLVSPLSSLVESVKRLTEGGMPGKLQIPHTEEIATLATEFNRMTENLDNIQKKLRRAERLATMSKFASVVAHEIRNPFNSIVINMQVLKRSMRRNESRDRIEQFMDIIDSEIRRIDGLIQNYLSLARPAEIEKESTDINVLIDELFILQHARAQQQFIKLKRRVDEDSILIDIDSNQIKQAFLNIILNAFQAMPDGGELIAESIVNHGEKKYNNMIKIAFIDTGLGISNNKINEIFEFFYTSKKGGTGLGLAVTKQIITSHKGAIEVSSKENEGTVISLYLPTHTEDKKSESI